MENNINERAMLVHLRISMWRAREKDRKVSREVVTQKNADDDSGAWVTQLVPKKALGPVQKARNVLYNTHIQHTLPWMDGGERILPSKMFMDYSSKMRKATEGFNKAVEEFLMEYPSLVADAEQRLGALLEDKRLPTTDEIRGKFGVHQDVLPMPTVKDFRLDLPNEQLSEIQHDAEQTYNDRMGNAMGSLWERFVELIGKIELTLGEPDKIFRDSLIGNLSDFCKLVPKLNLTNDERLEAIRKEAVAKLAKLRPDNLREDKAERTKASIDAGNLLNKIRDYDL